MLQGPILPRKFKSNRDSGGYEVLIAPRWLVGLSPEQYQKHLKQAFLLAVVDLKLSDTYSYTKGFDRKSLEALRPALLRRRNSIREGIIVEIRPEFLPRKQFLEDAAHRQPLVMQNTGWLSRSTKHFFTLQGAQLTIFEKVQGGSPGKMMNLLGATVTIETDKPSTTASVANSVAVEVFGRSFNSSNPMPGSHRVVVTLPKMRLWLCANSQELAKHWYRCIHLANRIRQTGKGKLALEAPLDTLTNILKQQSRRRTWDLLVLCYKTWQQRRNICGVFFLGRRQDVRALSQLLEAKAVRRIWQRLREVHRFYQSRPPEESSEDEEKEAKRKEMHRQVLKDLRHKAVNWIQARARELYSKESHHLAGRRGPPNAMRTLRARMPVGGGGVRVVGHVNSLV
eukprot:symbB.v1.2.002067.t1/scaffold111.1/size324890/1